MSAISDAAGLGYSPYPSMTENPGPDYANAESVVNEGTQYVADQKALSEPPQPVFNSLTYKDGSKGKSVSVDMPQATFDRLQNLMQSGHMAEQAFAQARQGLTNKRQFLESHPLVGALGKIASTAAAGYASGATRGDVSPIVRAAGAFGLDYFGKSTDQLASEEAGLAQQQFGIAKGIISEQQQEEGLRQAQERTDINKKNSEINQARLLEETQIHKDNELRKELGDATAPYETGAQHGAFVDKAAFRADPEVRRTLKNNDALIDKKADAINAIAQASRDATKMLAEQAAERRRQELLDKAHDREAERANAITLGALSGNLGKLGELDKQVTEAYSKAGEATSFFAPYATALGLPPPKTKAEADKITSMTYSKLSENPMNAKEAQGFVNKAALHSADMNQYGKIETLQTVRKSIYDSLPKEAKAAMTAPDTDFDEIDAYFLDNGQGKPTKAEKENFKQKVAAAKKDADRQASIEKNFGQPSRESLLASAPPAAVPQDTRSAPGNQEYPDLYQGGIAEVPRQRPGTVLQGPTPSPAKTRADLVVSRFSSHLRPGEEDKVRELIAVAMRHNPSISDQELDYNIRTYIKGLKEARDNETTVRSR